MSKSVEKHRNNKKVKAKISDKNKIWQIGFTKLQNLWDKEQNVRGLYEYHATFFE